MNCLRKVTLFCILLAVPRVSASQKRDIDWGAEMIRLNERFEFEYGAHEMDKPAQDMFVDNFVFITQNSIIQNNAGDLVNLYKARSELGHWEAERLNVVSTCGNSALIWANLVFTDGTNLTRVGKVVYHLEYVNEEAKIKLIQKTV